MSHRTVDEDIISLKELSEHPFAFKADLVLPPRSFRVVEELSSTSTRSLTYKIEWIDDPKKWAVAKIPRLSSRLSRKSIDIRIARIQYMQQVEVASTERLRGVSAPLRDRVAQVIASGTIDVSLASNSVGKEQIRLPVIIQEYIEGETLTQHLKQRALKTGSARFVGISDALDFAEIARSIVSLLCDLHRNQIIHGDISPDNIMVKSNVENESLIDLPIRDLGMRLTLIDFGESVFRNEVQMEDLVAVGALYDKPEATSEMYDIRQAGLLLAYLAGAHIATLDREMRTSTDAVQRIEAIRRSVNSNNPGLLSTSPGIADILSKCLCASTGERVQSFDELAFLLETLLAFPPDLAPHGNEDQSTGEHRIAPLPIDRKKVLDLLDDVLRYGESHTKSVLCGLLLPTITNFVSQAQDLLQGVQFINGSMREIEVCLASVFARVREGDEYLTLSSVDFWEEGNLGADSVFLTMNKIALRRGMRIRRVFIVAHSEVASEEMRNRLRRVLQPQRALLSYLVRPRPVSSDDPCSILIYLTSDEHKRRLISHGNNFGVLVCREESQENPVDYITLNLQYSERQIIGVKFNLDSDVGAEYKTRFNYFYSRSSMSLQEFWERYLRESTPAPL